MLLNVQSKLPYRVGELAQYSEFDLLVCLKSIHSYGVNLCMY